MRIFLSHISEEAKLAGTIKEQLELALPGAEVFVSAVDIHLGQAWLKAIDEALANAKAVVVLCSPRSIKRPWVNFESGGGWSRGLPVIPLCHGGLRKEELPHPLSIFQGMDLDGARDCEALAQRIGAILELGVAEGFDFGQMARNLTVKPTQRSSDIGIVLTHGQSEWDAGRRSVFDLPKALPQQLGGSWTFRSLHQVDDLLSQDLHTLSGLILGNPWRHRMEAEVVSALVDWVTVGGKLLLLGFELGDRHHGSNLGDLSRIFGIHPRADIVGPPGHGTVKPYGIPVDFKVSAGDPHSLTQNLSAIRLANVQTLYVEPGGTEWLRVGNNVVYYPARMSVEYHRGALAQPRGAELELNEQGGWLPIAVEAPRGLCGAGLVQAIGTWDLLGRREAFQNEDNMKLLQRLLDWLSGPDS